MACCSTGDVLQFTDPRQKAQTWSRQIEVGARRCRRREAFSPELRLQSTSLPKLIRCGLVGCIDLGQKEVEIFHPFSTSNIFNNYFAYCIEVQARFFGAVPQDVACHVCL